MALQASSPACSPHHHPCSKGGLASATPRQCLQVLGPRQASWSCPPAHLPAREADPDFFPIPFPHLLHFPFKMYLSCASLHHCPAVCGSDVPRSCGCLLFNKDLVSVSRGGTQRVVPVGALGPWPPGRAVVFACSGCPICITDSSPRCRFTPSRGAFQVCFFLLVGVGRHGPIGVNQVLLALSHAVMTVVSACLPLPGRAASSQLRARVPRSLVCYCQTLGSLSSKHPPQDPSLSPHTARSGSVQPGQQLIWCLVLERKPQPPVVQAPESSCRHSRPLASHWALCLTYRPIRPESFK